MNGSADSVVASIRNGSVRLRHLLGRRHMPHDQVEQRVQVLARAVKLLVGPAGAARGVEMREIELVVIGAKVGEQVEHLVQGAVGLGIGLVDLVQHHDGRRPRASALEVTNFVCGIGPSAASTSRHHAIDHGQDAFHLAAEIGVAGGVDDVDAHAVMFDAGAFRQNRDAALAFDVVAVHRAFGRGLVVADRCRTV